MNPMQIARAYQAISSTNLAQIPMSYHDARALAQLRQALTEEYETVYRAEQEMVARYNGKYTPTGYEFPSAQMANAYRQEHQAFCAADEPMDLPVLDLSAYVDKLQITADAVDALTGIVIFEPQQATAEAVMENGG